jgi:hypothetical protein
MATVVRTGLVCEHCGKFLDFSYGTESAVGVLCLYCRGYVEIRDDLLVTLRMEATNMADTQHTPGPWYAAYSKTNEFPGGNIRSNHHRHGEGALLFQTGPMFHDYTPDREEELANLRLASSAPELLKALENAYTDINYLLIEGFDTDVEECTIDGVKDTIREIKQAIAKAKGGA